jgi:hypothetical protein
MGRSFLSAIFHPDNPNPRNLAEKLKDEIPPYIALFINCLGIKDSRNQAF